MSTTTTRKRRNEVKSARRCNKKRKIEHDEEEKSFFDSIPEEVKMLILVQVPFNEFSQLRLVCSTWNKMTRSSVFGKLTCIMEYGSNAAPLRISNLSSLCSASDADSFIIPIIAQDSKLIIDWFEYVKLRSLRDRVINEWELVEVDPSLTQFLNTELSLQNIKDFIQFYIENVFNRFTCRSTEVFHIFALKLVPHLLRYKQIDLVRDLIGAFLFSESEDYHTESRPNGFLRTRIYLDLFDVSPTHFPDYTLQLYDTAITIASAGFDYHRGSLNIPTVLHIQLLRRVLVTMIQQGATGTLEDAPSFQQHFKQPFNGCYQIILPRHNDTFLNTIITTCTEEFNNATDWRVQLSAVTVSQVTYLILRTEFLCSQINFALSVLARANLHPEVRRAATFILIEKMSHHCDETELPLPSQTLQIIFGHFVDALIYLDKDERIDALRAITLMIENSYKNESIDYDMIEKLNTHIIAFLSTLDITNDMPCKRVLSIYDGIEVICAVLGPRSSQYLRGYHDVLLSIIKNPNNASPELWLALYFVIGCLISEFSEEAKQIIAQVERGRYAQVTIRKSMFYACSEHVQPYAPCSENQYIEQVLSIFPQVILDGLDSPVTFSADYQLGFINSWLATILTTKISVYDYEGPSKPIENEPPSYVPHSEKQWTDAISRIDAPISRIRTRSTMKKLFDFKPIKQETMSFDNIANFSVIESTEELTKMLDVPELKLATKIIDKWIGKDKGRKYYPKFLHILIAHMMTSPEIRINHLRHSFRLLYYISFDISEYYLARCCTIIAKTILTDTESSCSQITSYIGAYIYLLQKVRHVEPDLLIALAKLSISHLCISYETGFANFIRPSIVCEMMVKKWPKAAWSALANGELFHVPFFCEDYPHYNSIQLWQIKVFGMKRIANLHCTNVRAYSPLALESLLQIENEEKDYVPLNMIDKLKLYCELCTIDPDIGELNYFNQFLFDQHKLKSALIKANKYPGEMKYYSELLL